MRPELKMSYDGGRAPWESCPIKRLSPVSKSTALTPQQVPWHLPIVSSCIQPPNSCQQPYYPNSNVTGWQRAQLSSPQVANSRNHNQRSNPVRIAPPPLSVIRGIETQLYAGPAMGPPDRRTFGGPLSRAARDLGVEPLRSIAFVCDACDRHFKTKDLLELHEAEDHVLCDFEGCSWSGPPGILLGHKLSHVKTADGLSVMASADETESWLASRRRARALARAHTREDIERIKAAPLKLSILEQTLRSGQRAGHRAFDKCRKYESVLLPQLDKYTALFENRRRDLLKPNPYIRPGGKISPSAASFPICTPVLYNKPCPHPGQCRKVHDLKMYYRWKTARDNTGARMRSLTFARQAINYVLVADQVVEYEQIAILAIKAIYKSNYLQDL